MQIICRLSQRESNEPYTKLWWPQIESSLKHADLLVDKKSLPKYMLHARHGKPEGVGDNLKQLMGDSFENVLKDYKAVY